MTVYSQSFTWQQLTTDAGFRSWGKFISDSLESGGFIKHTDTGQIDWATVSKPTAGTNIIMGYEIRKTNDGKTTVYAKIEYGSGYNANCPGWKISLGTGTNGSGTLTGAGGTFTPYTAMGAGSTCPQMTVVSASNSRMTVSCFEPAEAQWNYHGGFQFSRTCDSDGTDNSTGYGLMGWGYGQTNNGIGTQYAEFVGGYGTIDQSSGIQILRVSRQVRANSGTSLVFPVFWSGLTTMPLMRDALVVPYIMGGHAGMIQTINHMGANRQYLVAYGPSTSSACWGYTSPDYFSLLVRCD